MDFLEAWVERIMDEPEDNISVCNAFDSDQYGPQSYISYLVDRLIENYIMQCNYTDEPLRFDTPTFRALLERCQKVGMDLFNYEPQTKGDYSLFDDLYGMRELAHLVPLRMNDEQPILIKASLYMVFLNVRGLNQELASEYMEYCVACIPPEIGAYLYRDAAPVEDPEYKRTMDTIQADIDTIEQRLASIDENINPLKHNNLQEQLAEKKLSWETMSSSEERYIVSPNDLDIYRQYGSNLYF